ncbi:MAG: hypothetical protein PUB00_07575 [Clostridiales bacterium]|nr:hypothetical protein [Clostridiales bacterium]
MQQDAVRRVREMQRIANSKLNGAESEKKQLSQPPPQSSEPSNNRNQPHISGRQNNHHPEIPLAAHSDASDRSAEKTLGQDKIKDQAPKNTQPGGNFIEDMLSQLNLDQDRLIILLLLIVLMREGTDSKLLLALCYLLL